MALNRDIFWKMILYQIIIYCLFFDLYDLIECILYVEELMKKIPIFYFYKYKCNV